MNQFNTFITDDTGAVTVEWVVVTAAVVGLALATMAVVSGGVEDLSQDTSGAMSDYEIDADFDGAGEANAEDEADEPTDAVNAQF
ncbi:pilus assembly protein [Roseibacterium beibuensis]|uniref:Flp pilus assembly protein, pilin Flp n=1 Tax=[Roseibacterium] beibuensis TaxID=1193142 RepID=A0ABP9LIG3_9RHOB|nr:pilus assembly protein [Roseibacterium beibuensis]MCS6623631.1 pilus assembly protein [Roseibacterium beibuensis]